MVGQTVSTVWQKKKRNSVSQLNHLWTKFYIVTIQITPLQQTVHSSGACLSILLHDEIWDFFKLIFSCDGSEKHRMSSAQTQWYYVVLHMSVERNVSMILIFNSSNFGLQIFIECLLPWNEKYQHSSVKFFVTFEACK